MTGIKYRILITYFAFNFFQLSYFNTQLFDLLETSILHPT